MESAEEGVGTSWKFLQTWGISITSRTKEMSSFSLVLTVLYRYEYERSGKPMQESTFTKNICLDFSSQKFIVTLKIMKRKELFVRGS
jgi:hypothetical protein